MIAVSPSIASLPPTVYSSDPSNATVALTLTAVPSAAYTLTVQSVDVVGNVGSPFTTTFVVDMGTLRKAVASYCYREQSRQCQLPRPSD